MTVGELLDRISSREISEWAALYRIEREEQDAADRHQAARR